MGEKARPGDGVLGGAGTVDGRPGVLLRPGPDATPAARSASSTRTRSCACSSWPTGRKAPVVGFVSSGGARMQEGVAALGGYGRIFHRIVKLSGRVPQVSIVTGLSAGGGAYSPALTDWVVMTEESSMFLTGPAVVREALGEDVSARRARRHPGARAKRRLPLRRAHRRDAAYLARELLGYLPRHRDAAGAAYTAASPRSGYDPSGRCPRRAAPRLRRARRDPRPRRRRRAARGGRRVGAQPRHRLCPDRRPHRRRGRQPAALPGRGARRRRARRRARASSSKCNAFGIPLLVLVDTPGYMPGTTQESAGVIRFGAGFVHAFAEAEVPRVTLILRKAFGGAYITMNSKDLGADYVFAWPSAQIGVMAARSGGRDHPPPRAGRRRRSRRRPRSAGRPIRRDAAAARGWRPRPATSTS